MPLVVERLGLSVAIGDDVLQNRIISIVQSRERFRGGSHGNQLLTPVGISRQLPAILKDFPVAPHGL